MKELIREKLREVLKESYSQLEIDFNMKTSGRSFKKPFKTEEEIKRWVKNGLPNENAKIIKQQTEYFLNKWRNINRTVYFRGTDLIIEYPNYISAADSFDDFLKWIKDYNIVYDEKIHFHALVYDNNLVYHFDRKSEQILKNTGTMTLQLKERI